MVVSDQRRAVGVFSQHQEAEQALNELEASGFPRDQISIIAKQVEQNEQVGDAQLSDRIGNQNVNTATGAVADALTTSFWGTVLVGLGSLALPGIGPVIAAGSLGLGLVTAVAGTGVGAVATRGLVKALADLGIPEEQAGTYSDRLQQGNYLVILDGTEDEIGRVATLLKNQGIQDWGVYNPPSTAE